MYMELRDIVVLVGGKVSTWLNVFVRQSVRLWIFVSFSISGDIASVYMESKSNRFSVESTISVCI